MPGERDDARTQRSLTESQLASSLGVSVVENHQASKNVESLRMRGNSCRPAAEATERLNLETCLACNFHCEQLDLFLTRATRQTVNKGHSTGSTLTKGGWTTEARKEGLQNQEANSRRQT